MKDFSNVEKGTSVRVTVPGFLSGVSLDGDVIVQVFDADVDPVYLQVDPDDVDFDTRIKWGEVYRKGNETFVVTGTGGGDLVIRRMIDDVPFPESKLEGAVRILDVDDTA